MRKGVVMGYPDLEIGVTTSGKIRITLINKDGERLGESFDFDQTCKIFIGFQKAIVESQGVRNNEML